MITVGPTRYDGGSAESRQPSGLGSGRPLAGASPRTHQARPSPSGGGLLSARMLK